MKLSYKPDTTSSLFRPYRVCRMQLSITYFGTAIQFAFSARQINVYLPPTVSEMTSFSCKPDMTSSWFLRSTQFWMTDSARRPDHSFEVTLDWHVWLISNRFGLFILIAKTIFFTTFRGVFWVDHPQITEIHNFNQRKGFSFARPRYLSYCRFMCMVCTRIEK